MKAGAGGHCKSAWIFYGVSPCRQKRRSPSGLIETLESQAFRESDHQPIEMVGQLIKTEEYHPFWLRHKGKATVLITGQGGWTRCRTSEGNIDG